MMNDSALEADPLVEEVRVAMALNGGVSLAVWMAGCVAELDCARRAHLAPEQVTDGSERRVYHALTEAFRRELVIDLMSGSSAGGINGALLAASIRHCRRLNPSFLRTQWLELGDLGKILHRTSEPSPLALMQGKLFHKSLLKAFNGLLNDASTKLPAGQESLPELDVSLDVTTTDVVGEQRKFLDYWERPLVAREHRARFRFRTPVDYVPSMLAEAARASASFPIAFEPWRIEAPVGDLAAFTSSRWVLDGGLLDNAPIQAALELIPTRPFDRQVRRYICYMNAEPPSAAGNAPAAGLECPPLATVSGYVIGLPRKATFVDQLNAIERATRASTLRGTTTPALDLLSLDLGVLETTALALLPSYQQGRHLISLEEIFSDPARAREAYKLVPVATDLPWVPNSLAPRDMGAWQWGLRPTLRIFQLLLDILRRAATKARPDERKRLFKVGQEVSRHLRGIEQVGACFAQSDPGYGSVSEAMERARRHIESFDPVPPLRLAVEAVHQVRQDLVVDATHLGKALFGTRGDDGGFTGAHFDHFLRRALAIEVVRRAVAPDDEPFASGQDLRFAQLTPYAPALIFTADPLDESTCWNTPEQKLTGLALGHFAGFYRGSWRVNDFMWGRLDAAVRVVDLLVAPGRAKQLHDDGVDVSTAEKLADGLLTCQPEAEQRWLLDEALNALAGPPLPSDDEQPPLVEDLRSRLVRVIAADLRLPGGAPVPGLDKLKRPGDFTRIVCARAAQMEVIADELEPLDEQSVEDVRLGAGAAALKLPLGTGSLTAAIANLRNGPPLPERLSAPDEAASALAMRTGTQAALVTLGVLRTATPLLRILFVLRAGLLPVAGSVARRWWNRLGAMAAFCAAELFLSARALTTPTHGSESLDTITLTAILVALFASFVVIGTAAVPGFRSLMARRRRRKIEQGIWAALFVVSGGLAAALLAWFAGGVSLGRLITAAGAERPPDWVLYAIVAFVLGAPIAAAPALVRGQLAKILAKPWSGVSSLLLVAALAGLLIGYSVGELWSALDRSWWEVTLASIALFAAPAIVLVSLFVRRVR
jgi:predicted acylesterase/phospholipase RssA